MMLRFESISTGISGQLPTNGRPVQATTISAAEPANSANGGSAVDNAPSGGATDLAARLSVHKLDGLQAAHPGSIEAGIMDLAAADEAGRRILALFRN